MPFFAKSAGELDLAAEREHVRRQPVGEDHGGIDLALAALRDGLVEKGGEGRQALPEDGGRGLVHREGHGCRSVGVRVLGRAEAAPV